MKLLTTISLLLMTSFLFSQEPDSKEFKYSLSFEDVSQYEIKQIIGVINPLFDANVRSEGSDFTRIYYVSSKTVLEQEVTDKLQESNLDFKFEFKKTEK